MKLFVVNGSIGSGKTSFTNRLLQHFDFSNIEYINADYYLTSIFTDSNASMDSRYELARQFREYKKKSALEQGRSILLESVIAKQHKLHYIENCKKSGYYVTGFFVGIDDVEKAISRTKHRANVNSMWQVEADKVTDRYIKVMNNLPTFFMLCDEFIAIDNSQDSYVLSMYFDGKTCNVNSDMRWIYDILISDKSVKDKLDLCTIFSNFT